jgi:hypothetical protein
VCRPIRWAASLNLSPTTFYHLIHYHSFQCWRNLKIIVLTFVYLFKNYHKNHYRCHNNLSLESILNQLDRVRTPHWLFLLGHFNIILPSGGAQIPDARSPWWLNFVQWCLIFVGPQYGTCFMSPLWRLECWGRCSEDLCTPAPLCTQSPKWSFTIRLFQTNICTQFSFPPRVLHAPNNIIFFVWSC